MPDTFDNTLLPDSARTLELLPGLFNTATLSARLATLSSQVNCQAPDEAIAESCEAILAICSTWEMALTCLRGTATDILRHTKTEHTATPAKKKSARL